VLRLEPLCDGSRDRREAPGRAGTVCLDVLGMQHRLRFPVQRRVGRASWELDSVSDERVRNLVDDWVVAVRRRTNLLRQRSRACEPACVWQQRDPERVIVSG
jgi:hypothetical protein